MYINETEEYLGILREKKALLHLRLAEADDQIGVVREVLDSDGIPEVSLSDDEDSSSDTFPSDAMVHNTSDAESDPEPATLHYPVRYDSSGSSSSSKEGVWARK